jgi:hypothetical protein
MLIDNFWFLISNLINYAKVYSSWNWEYAKTIIYYLGKIHEIDNLFEKFRDFFVFFSSSYRCEKLSGKIKDEKRKQTWKPQRRRIGATFIWRTSGNDQFLDGREITDLLCCGIE